MTGKKVHARAKRRRSTSPNYTYWASLKTLDPYEATALSLSTDTDRFGPDTGESIEDALLFPLFKDRLRAIERQVGDAAGISAPELVIWMDTHGLNVPDGLRAAANMEKRRTLDRIAVGLTIKTTGWRPESATRQDYATQVADILEKLAIDSDDSSDPTTTWRKELRVHVDTVRTQLRSAFERLQE